MSQNRRFERVRPSGRVSKAGKIILDPKSPMMDCSIVDYSAGGACLEVSAPLPPRFELLYGNTRKKCRVIWTRGVRVGVTF
ncbi:MAG: PilZ domain-containing protein [Afipia sp.]|nr:PilZ domain-containing protein [Afipia sp.]OJW62171.1 MAG: pilus assembly protein PilZ [Afipia sp. 64-13]